MYAAVMSISAKKADKQNKMISGGFHAYGTIEVEVTLREQDVVISCTDHGVGIPPEKIPKLGEPFFTTKEKGTGLGLMMCHQIMEAHQGSMKIESQVGKGTRVELCLPVLPTSM